MGPCVFKMMGSGDFVMPSLNFDCRSLIALLRASERFFIYVSIEFNGHQRLQSNLLFNGVSSMAGGLEIRPDPSRRVAALPQAAPQAQSPRRK